MHKEKIWLSPPHIGGGELKYIEDALNSNWIAPMGSNLDGFESDLENYLGSHHVTALNSGTAAIHLGLISLGVKSGDTVLCQSMTFSASANPILYLGSEPIFIDSELDTWNICPIALEEAIVDSIARGKQPKAIIAVHLYGIPYKIEEIRLIADKYCIPILEDSAEALGSSFKGQLCGTFGDVAAFSFNGSKIITTSGGGALVTASVNDKDYALFLATQAKDEAAHYEHSTIGYNYRLSNVCAGIGRGQMERLQDYINLRRSMHDFYIELFDGIAAVSVHSVPNANYFSNYWLTTILVNPDKLNGITAEKLRLAFKNEHIESRPLMKPMHLQPVFQECGYYGKNIAEQLFKTGLCLPSGSSLTDLDRERIKNVVRNTFGK